MSNVNIKMCIPIPTGCNSTLGKCEAVMYMYEQLKVHKFYVLIFSTYQKVVAYVCVYITHRYVLN